MRLLAFSAAAAALCAPSGRGVHAAQVGAARRLLIDMHQAMGVTADATASDLGELYKAELATQNAIKYGEEIGATTEVQNLKQKLATMKETEKEVEKVAEQQAEHEDKADAALERGDQETYEKEESLAERLDEEHINALDRLAEIVERERKYESLTLAEYLDVAGHASLLGSNLAQHAARAHEGASVAIGLYRDGVGKGVESVLGARGTVVFSLLEWTTLLAPVAFIAAVFHVIRQNDSGREFELHSEVMLFAHLYFAVYYTLVAVATFMAEYPPLTAFAEMQPHHYVAYQMFVFVLYLIYLGIICFHAHQARNLDAALQVAGGAFVFIHSYFGILYPAMHSHIGPRVGSVGFMMYAACFASMCGLHKRERDRKQD